MPGPGPSWTPAWSWWHSSQPTTTRTAPAESTAATSGIMRLLPFPFVSCWSINGGKGERGQPQPAGTTAESTTRTAPTATTTTRATTRTNKKNGKTLPTTARAERNGRARAQVRSPSPPQPSVPLRCPYLPTSSKDIHVVDIHPPLHEVPWAALFSPHLGSCQLMATLPSWHTDDDDTTCVPCVRVNAPHPRTKPNVEGTSPWYDFMGWEGRNRRPGTGANGKES